MPPAGSEIMGRGPQMRAWRPLLIAVGACVAVIPAHAQDTSSAVVLADDFSDPARGVLPSVSPQPAAFTAAYVNGAYQIDSVDPAQADVIPLPGDYADSTLALDATLSGDTVHRLLRLTCRQPDGMADGGYRLLVNFNALTFMLHRVDSGQHTTLVDATPYPAPAGPWTHLELGCTGSTITVAINGAALASVADGTYSVGTSDIGIGGGAGLAEARFQNLMVSGPPGAAELRLLVRPRRQPVRRDPHRQRQLPVLRRRRLHGRLRGDAECQEWSVRV